MYSVGPVWPEKNCQMSVKVAKNDFTRYMIDFWHLHKNCLRLWEIWANELLPKSLKSCPKSNKSPNLVTLFVIKWPSWSKWLFESESVKINQVYLISDFSLTFFLKNGPTPASFIIIFGLFKQTSLQFLQQIYVIKCPSSIRGHDLNHDLPNMILFP